MELISSHICMTKDLGNHGNLFGGTMMSWLDSAAYILAAKKAKSSLMVTKVVNTVDFKRATKETEIIEIYGEVSNVGNSSLTIELMAKKIDVASGERVDKCILSMVFVRINEHGNKNPFSEDEKKEMLK